VLDAFSRMIIGWQLAGHMRTDLVLDARSKPFSAPRRGEHMFRYARRLRTPTTA
jgi:hypothetical protein